MHYGGALFQSARESLGRCTLTVLVSIGNLLPVAVSHVFQTCMSGYANCNAYYALSSTKERLSTIACDARRHAVTPCIVCGAGCCSLMRSWRTSWTRSYILSCILCSNMQRLLVMCKTSRPETARRDSVQNIWLWA